MRQKKRPVADTLREERAADPGRRRVFRWLWAVVGLADGGFLALSRTCPHLGCSSHWDATKKTFLCPCHGSSFDGAGEVVTAPAQRPMEYYPVRIENGIIKVDVAAPRRRERFEPAQATRI